MTRPPTVGPSDQTLVERLRELLAKVEEHPTVTGLPWVMRPADGKPLLCKEGGVRTCFAYGTIGSWSEIELAVAAVNALPALLARITALQREAGWQDIENNPPPREGFFLVWGAHQPEIAWPYEGGRFWKARAPEWPAHLSSRAFTHWRTMPLPDPSRPEGEKL